MFVLADDDDGTRKKEEVLCQVRTMLLRLHIIVHVFKYGVIFKNLDKQNLNLLAGAFTKSNQVSTEANLAELD